MTTKRPAGLETETRGRKLPGGPRRWLGMTAVILGLGVPAAVAQPEVELRLVADGMTAPHTLRSYAGTDNLLVVDQAGVIHFVEENGTVRDEPFLDVRDRMLEIRSGFDERGLLGLAVHPEFEANGHFFVYYSAPLREEADRRFDHTSHVSRFTVENSDTARADPDSEVVVMEIDQPQFNHNGGSLVFGPDGYLYISVGDGGGGNDTGHGHPPEGNGQDFTTLLGSILRIDVDGDEPYGIPEDNPFVGSEGRDEIFAYGLRNVWGMAFDRGGDGRFFAADVGQDMFEEVNIIESGGNYGWNIREGFHCFDPGNPGNPPEDCPDEGARGEPLLDPIIEYKNRRGFDNEADALGVSVIGGYVYRGEALPDLEGRYLFGDWSRSWAQPDGVLLVAAPPEGDPLDRWEVRPLDTASHPEGRVSAFVLGLGEDRHGEIYVMTNDRNGPSGDTGKVYRLAPAND